MNFDSQAAYYDKRAGLPEGVPLQIASAVCAGLDMPEEMSMLEVGTGTGEIGIELATAVENYTGFDVSLNMLDHFKKRARDEEVRITLKQADGHEKWPTDDHSIDVIFSSRALHLLNTEHVASEVVRVAKGNKVRVIMGKVKRDHDTLQSHMRRIMRKILKEHGLEGRDGRKQFKNLTERLSFDGSVSSTTTPVGRWRTQSTPRHSITSWRNKEGLAGLNMAKSVKEKVLQQVENEAMIRFKNLDTPETFDEWYELTTIEITNLKVEPKS